MSCMKVAIQIKVIVISFSSLLFLKGNHQAPDGPAMGHMKGKKENK